MEQEISLREIVEILWRGKWIIILVTLFTMVASAIYSIYFIEPTYEARVTISVNSNNIDGNGVSLPKYTEQVKSHAVMRATIQELQLGQDGVTINSLRDRISTEIIRDTNLFRILIKGNDGEKTSQIANSVTKNFLDYIKSQETEKIIASIVYEESNLVSELNIKREIVAKVQKDLSNTPQFINVSKSLTQDPFLHSVVMDYTKSSNSETGAINYVEEVLNPVYLTLQQNLTNTQIEIQSLESQITELQNKVDQQQIVAKEYLLVASPAIPPEKPIAPRKTLNVAVAGVLGGMISLFIVFFIHYWKSTAIKSRREENHQQLSV